MLAVSTLTGDPRLYSSYAQWLEDVLTTRGTPPARLAAGIESLWSRLPAGAFSARDLCDRRPRRLRVG